MASSATANGIGCYLYGIALADDGPASPRPGINGSCLEAIVEDGVAAIVSRLDAENVRPQRANLTAHHRILHDLAARQAVLPAVFGTIADSEEELRDILRQHRDEFIALLERVRGKVEMGLKVYWEPPNIFEYFVATHQELEALRDRLFRPGRVSSLEEKVALGELFARLLQDARQRHTHRVQQALAPYCSEVRSIDSGDERVIMKLACLLGRDRQPLWEEGVRAAAALFDDNYRFQYSGPFPPYNFTNLDLQRGERPCFS